VENKIGNVDFVLRGEFCTLTVAANVEIMRIRWKSYLA